MLMNLSKHSGFRGLTAPFPKRLEVIEFVLEGYIKLYRQIMDNNFLWNNEPFTRGQAWIDILLWTSHSDHEAPFDGGIIEIKRGTYVTSVRKLCERWKWSNTKVFRFLSVLQREQMLIVNSDAKKTVLTVMNWELFQSQDDAETSQKRQRNVTETPQKHTDKNGKECTKNGKNNIKALIADFSPEFQTAFTSFSEMRKSIKKPLTENAASLVLKKLEKIGHSDSERIEILNNSTMNCWQGVFELKGIKNQPQSNHPNYSDPSRYKDAESEDNPFG
jgi:hypothetical protein